MRVLAFVCFTTFLLIATYAYGPAHLHLNRAFNASQAWLASRQNPLCGTAETPTDTHALLTELKQLREENLTLRTAGRVVLDTGIAAQVIAYHPLDSEQLIFLNRGKKDGVQPGAVAVDEGGRLAGHILNVFPHTSELLLISNPENAIDVRIGKDGYRALLSGRFEKLTASRGLWLTQGEFISQHQAVTAGEEVVTSGLDGRYPPHLLVGTVYEVHYDELKLFKTAIVAPAVDFTLLKTVYLLPALDD